MEDLVVRMDQHLTEHFPNISGISHFVKAPSHKHVGQTVYVVWSFFEMDFPLGPFAEVSNTSRTCVVQSGVNMACKGKYHSG